MSSRTATQRNAGTRYRRQILIIAVITTILTALGVAIAIWNSVRNTETKLPVVEIPAPTPPAVQTPVSTPTPAVMPTVCGQWGSVSSRKIYVMVCTGQSSFQIREMSNDGQVNSGSGRIGLNGEIQGELRIARNGRIAHLRLQLSSDGQRLEGTWHGDDASESGSLSFYRIQ